MLAFEGLLNHDGLFMGCVLPEEGSGMSQYEQGDLRRIKITSV